MVVLFLLAIYGGPSKENIKQMNNWLILHETKLKRLEKGSIIIS